MFFFFFFFFFQYFWSCEKHNLQKSCLGNACFSEHKSLGAPEYVTFVENGKYFQYFQLDLF